MLSNRNLEFSAEAVDDIRAILQYTREQWGDGVRRQYARRLDTSLLRLLDHLMVGHSQTDLSPGLRPHPSGEHVIYYRLAESGFMVRRVLHHRHALSPDDVS